MNSQFLRAFAPAALITALYTGSALADGIDRNPLFLAQRTHQAVAPASNRPVEPPSVPLCQRSPNKVVVALPLREIADSSPSYARMRFPLAQRLN